MDTHVKVYAALNVAMGAIGVVGAGVIIIGVFGAAGIAGASHDPDAAIALPIIGFTGMALALFALILAVPAIVTGIGLLRLRPWARIAGIVIAIGSLIWFPFGTIVGAYGLWVLFSKDTERLFMAATSGSQPT